MLPDVLCAIQVCFEGQIRKESVNDQMKRGLRPSGDLIPWTVSEQYQDESFASLSGARVVRIATHPAAQKKGYGSRAIEILVKYFQGSLIDSDAQLKDATEGNKKAEKPSSGLTEEKLKPKKHVKPIL